MHPKKAYKFCPKCGFRLAPQKGNLLQCVSCHFRLYINPLVTNGVIIENTAGKILLVRRAFAPKKGFWDVPGGFIAPKESVEASVKRELKEELSVEVEVCRIIGAYADTYLFDGIIYDTLCIMVAAEITAGTIAPGDDACEYAFFPKEAILGQRIAFAGIRRALADYIKSAAALPNLTA